jgi:hypothetical protein
MTGKDKVREQAEEISRLRQMGMRNAAQPVGPMDVSSEIAGEMRVATDPNLRKIAITCSNCNNGPVRHQHLLKMDTGALGCLVPECNCRVYVTVVNEKRNG